MPKAIKIAVITIIMLLGMVFTNLPQNANAQTISFELDPLSGETVLRPTQSAQGTTTLNGGGTVNLVKPSVTATGRVQLSVSLQNMPGTVALSQEVFPIPAATTQHSFQFTVSVVVPPGTSSLTTGKVVVNGIATSEEGTTYPSSVTAILTIEQYFIVEVESGTPYIETAPGSQTIFSIKITNRGNGPDRFVLSINNLKSLTDSNWLVTLSKTTIESLESQGTAIFTVTTQAPRDWTIWKTKGQLIEIKVTSATVPGEPGLGQQVYPVYVYERGWYIDGFDPIFLILALAFMTVIFKKKVVKEKK